FVPRGAVRREGDAAYVFKVADGRLRRTEVALAPAAPASAGARNGAAGPAAAAVPAGDRVEVLSGVQGGDTIVRAGVEKLEDGEKVRAAESS
ncbi:MAG TPA: hypothetical protein VJA16_17545, partial [Thermoanaerobaculia bacterium]